MPSIDDLFPPEKRVVYRVNPLKNVVCQVRFPAILRIEAQPPADFQDAIRELFPLFERTVNLALPLPPELVQAMGSPGGVASYVFRTEDRVSAFTLTSEALTLETSLYRCWEDFWAMASRGFDALLKVYDPPFFSRAGLRYQNVILPKEIGLGAERWSNLLSPSVLGELSNEAWEQAAVETRRFINCKDESGDSVLLQHGIAQIEANNERVYFVDFDFFRDQRIERHSLPDVFKRFNSRSGRAFRWAISDNLHQVLGPEESHPA